MRTCLDCYNLKAKIPLIHINGDRKIDWNHTLVTCAKGYFQKNNGSERVYKNILGTKDKRDRGAFSLAERCMDYND